MMLPIDLREGYSMPFAVVTKMALSETIPFNCLRMSLNAEDGIDRNIISQGELP